MMIRLEEVMPDFVDEFASRPSSHWEERVAQKVREIGGLVERIEAAFPAQVIVQSMTLSHGGYFGINDPQRPDGQSALVQRFNQGLAAEFARRKGVYLWDFDRLVRAKGYENLYDPKMWYVSRNPFRQSAYPAIVDDLTRYVRSALGRIRKCVVVDLDNTLWGGIVGEDGIEGIGLGRDYPGNCYRDFQKELLKLYHRGILLAINSKNNEADALEVLDKHPDMVLRRKHFAAYRINWQDKASNLKALAKDLNIGIDSMVFIDDNPRECELVRQPMPRVSRFLSARQALPHSAIPGVGARPGVRQPHGGRQPARRDVPGAARQGASRGPIRESGGLLEGSRAGSQDRGGSAVLDSAYRAADAENQPDEHDHAPVHRVPGGGARRRSELAGSLSGSQGQVRRSRDHRRHVHQDGRRRLSYRHFLMSCRVLGMNIEQYMIAYAAAVARQAKSKRLVGEFIPTAKNKVAADMYPKLGFRKMSDTLFCADLEKPIVRAPEHIRPPLESLLPVS